MPKRRSALAVCVLVAAACSSSRDDEGADAAQTDPTSIAPAVATDVVTPTRVSATVEASDQTPPPTTIPTSVDEVIDLAFHPSAIAAAGELIWAEDHAATNRVYAFDPSTGQTVATLDFSRPCDLVFAFDRVWVADAVAGQLVSIDPTTYEIVDEVTGLRRPCGVQAFDGGLWLAVDDGLARVDSVTKELTIVRLPEAAFPGPNAPLWAALFHSGTLVHVDADSATSDSTVPHPEGTFEGPAVASAFSSLWVGGSLGLYRIDPATGAVVTRIPVIQPTRLLVTADAIWSTSYPGGVVERVDPGTNTIVFRARLGGNINGIAGGLGAIWVADTSRGRLYRIDPTSATID